MISPISWVKTNYQKGGLTLLGQRFKMHLFQTESAWWFFRNLLEPIDLFPVSFQAEVHRFPEDRILEYMIRKKYLSEEEYHVGRENGHWFIGLILNSEVKGFCKCGFRKVFLYDAHSVISLSEGMSFIYEYEVDEQIRGLGAGKYFVSSILRMLSEEGVRYTFCHIPPQNVASIQVVERCGFRKIGQVRFVEMFGFKWRTCNIENLIGKAAGA